MINNKFFQKHKSRSSGLSSQEASERLEDYGYNKLKVKKQEPLWLKFLHQFTDLMVVVLITAAVVSIIVALIEKKPEELTDAYIILGIVFLNAIIGFMQEFKAEKALEALQKMVAPRVRVIRDGTEQIIDAELLVPGDIMILAEGDKISADAELFEANELRIEESALTGESVPVQKNLSDKVKAHDLHHNPHLIFMGTAVSSGSGKAIVTHTGMQTEFGKIADMTISTTKDKSPLQKELTKIGLFVGKITLLISAVLFVVGMVFQGYSFIEALLFSVAVAVAAVPEGLPATITIALALGVQRLAKQNAIIKQLSSVETLGSTTVICSDKTGTLTKNEMTVTEVFLGDQDTITFEGTGYNPEGKINFPPKYNQDDFEKLIEISAICNEAKHVQDESGKWTILGDPTEGSLLVSARKANFNFEKGLQKTKTFPFDSIRKRMSVIVSPLSKGRLRGVSNNEVYVKGAPDNIIDLCTHILQNGKFIELTPATKTKLHSQNTKMAEKALRVLAIAYRRDIESEIKTTEDAEKNLVFVGLIGMIDPPRPEVKPAVQLCHNAGIRTVIITGDFGLTAKAIAQKITMANDLTPIITGVELEAMSEIELKKQLKEHKSLIFARVAPKHKKRVVNALKELGEVVAVTGDGVNDAPALKRADIGIAMGITGTDVSKEAANMILTDDSFASIITAVSEGRRIYKNLKKFVWYIFSCNIGELTTIFVAILLGIPAPLTAVLILAIDLGTDVLPALALGIDRKEPGIMESPPRNPQEHIMQKPFILHFVSIGMIIGFIVIGVYLYDLIHLGWMWGEDLSTENPIHLHASTMAFSTLVLIQMVNAFNARSAKHSIFKLKSNLFLWASVFISAIMIVFMVYLPWFQTKLHTTPLSTNDWIIIIFSSLIILAIEELRKLIMKNK